jgi:hypothetical protein
MKTPNWAVIADWLYLAYVLLRHGFVYVAAALVCYKRYRLNNQPPPKRQELLRLIEFITAVDEVDRMNTCRVALQYRIKYTDLMTLNQYTSTTWEDDETIMALVRYRIDGIYTILNNMYIGRHFLEHSQVNWQQHLKGVIDMSNASHVINTVIVVLLLKRKQLSKKEDTSDGS